MRRTCKDCLYANELEDGRVFCDKRVLEGVDIYIEEDRVGFPCPAHSSKNIEEFRCMRNNEYIHEDGEHCEICRRKVDIDDISQYRYIDIQDEDGNIIGDKIQCRICKEKGRR